MRDMAHAAALSSLAILGGVMSFEHPLHVGCPNIPNRAGFERRVGEILNRRWLSNNGQCVQEFENRLAEFLQVKHCLAICNATVALEIVIRALNLEGEVIVPSYTFIATAHALQWQKVRPVFADMDPESHNICPASIERLITKNTTAIIGVHVWGRPCDTEAIEKIARKNRIKVIYDAAHALGCTHDGRMIGGFGLAEIFSFHATKFINSLEGGMVATNDDELATRVRLMRNFGFTGYDKTEFVGTNGKMHEISGAMGLTNLECIDDILSVNRRNYFRYRENLSGLQGLSVINYNENERNNYQYIVIEVDPSAPLNRDDFITVLHAENVLSRKYFWPGCHRMEPYRTEDPEAFLHLPETEKISERLMVLPTGQSVDENAVEQVCRIIRAAYGQATAVRSEISRRRPK